jgi:hypothetical protein
MDYCTIVNFRGGKVRFVRMDLKAGMIQNLYIQKDLRANMSCKHSIVERI